MRVILPLLRGQEGLAPRQNGALEAEFVAQQGACTSKVDSYHLKCNAKDLTSQSRCQLGGSAEMYPCSVYELPTMC